MFASELIILSYHVFRDEYNDYRFSRTYDQFHHDIKKKVYDMITIDDGRECMIKACGILKDCNVRAKLFICTSLVGQPGYCTWEQLRELAEYHDIENHSHIHVDHRELSLYEIDQNIMDASSLIKFEIGKTPRYFVAPYNWYNDEVKMLCLKNKLIPLENRENILNISK